MRWTDFRRTRIAQVLGGGALLAFCLAALAAWSEGRGLSPEERARRNALHVRLDAAELLRAAAELPRAPGGGIPTPTELFEHGSMRQGAILDPWNREYVLEEQGGALRVRSLGPDGKPGTADDVTAGAEVLAEFPP